MPTSGSVGSMRSAEPALCAMFGLSGTDALVILRERVVLYCEAGAHRRAASRPLLAQVRNLRYGRVRAAIEAEKAELALRTRRVCPTARRGRDRRSRDTGEASEREMDERYESFSAFYPFYLSEHRNRTCRRLHFAGTTLGTRLPGAGGRDRPVVARRAGLVIGYAFAGPVTSSSRRTGRPPSATRSTASSATGRCGATCSRTVQAGRV